MNKFFLLISCLLLFCFKTEAQTVVEQISEDTSAEETQPVAEVEPDTTFYYTGNVIKEHHLDSLKKVSDYAYLNSIEKYLKERKQQAEGKLKEPVSSYSKKTVSSDKGSWFNKMTGKWEFKVMLGLLAVFFILVILYFFFVRNRLFSTNTRLKNVSVEPEDEKVEMHDFEKAYLLAKSKNDHRTAVKFLFLHCLYLLSEKQLVSFSIDKTNHEYLLEMPAHLQKDFARISLTYEYIWYGRQPLDAILFSEKENLYFQFINRIQTS